MKPISNKHQEFIRLVASGEQLDKAFRLTSSNKNLTSGTARVEGSKLAKRYAVEIQTAKKQAADIVEQANNSEAAQSALKSILTQAQVDAKLCSIINGTFEYEDVVPVQGKLMKLMRKPSSGDVSKAIDLYNKRFGSNAPTKTEQTNIGGLNIKITRE